MAHALREGARGPGTPVQDSSRSVRKSKSAVTDCSSCSTLKTIQSATAIITTSHIAQGGGVSTWPEAVRTWPEAVRTWPKAVHILVVGRLGR